jgi:outer membrane autotransporter protein
VIFAQLQADQAAGTLDLDLRRRTAEEAGLNAAEAAAYDPIFAGVSKDATLQSSLFSPTEREAFIGAYDQMLPDYGGGVFRLASAAARATSRAAAEGGPGGAWVQEITLGAHQQASSGALPYHSFGLGVAAGVEREARVGVFGLDAGFFTGDSRPRRVPGDNQSSLTELQAGLSWRGTFGGLVFDARGGGAYVRSNTRRQFVTTAADGTETVQRTAEGKSTGWSLTGRLGASYRAQMGGLYLQPGVHLDYFRLRQGAYTETGGGDGFNLAVEARTGQETSATASLRVGTEWGEGFTWRPELEVGYRSVLSGDPGGLTARFAAGGNAFTLEPAKLDSGGALARLGIVGGNEVYSIALSAGAERRSGYTEGDVHFKARLLF